MKTLKLEVGKTYRNRNGEEVKIVGKDGVMYPFKGDNGAWYAESGRYDYDAGETSRDLIEEVEAPPATRHAFSIPDGVKEITVEQVGNRIVVEMVPEEVEGPKPGDVMINVHESVYIFKEPVGKNTHKSYAWLGKYGRLAIGKSCFSGRPATPEEAQPLFDALKKAGKKWNPKTMQVEEVPESTRIREWVQEHLNDGYYNQQGIAEVIGNYLNQKEGVK